MKKAIATLVAVIGLSSSVFAAANSDIILGFRATAGTGSTNNLEINLGSITSLKGVVGTTTLFNLTDNGVFGTNGVDDIYGASWNTRDDLLFGVGGAVPAFQTGPQGQGQKTLFGGAITSISLLDGVQTATAYNRASASTQGTGASKFATLYNGVGTAGQFVNLDSSDVNSWSTNGGTAGLSFGFFQRASFEGSTNITGNYVAADLFEIIPGSGLSTYVGTLAIWQNGNVTFSTMAAAIPEPSTYAAILGGVVLAVAAYRRRKQAALV